MPVIVILSDCPPKLRGDMTKWFFEINTGVYVGNISARVRENLWLRITENIGRGHATMVYNAPGEQRMDFRVHNAYWEPTDFDGIKLMRRPERTSLSAHTRTGFSNASKHRMAAAHAKKPRLSDTFLVPSYVALALKTTGSDENKDKITEISAIFVDRGKVEERMRISVCCDNSAPSCDGQPLEDAVQELLDFAEDFPFVCYNAAISQLFLTAVCQQMHMVMENRFIDIRQMAEILLPDIAHYELSELTRHFKLDDLAQHRVLDDCEAINGIYTKLKELAISEKRKNEQ